MVVVVVLAVVVVVVVNSSSSTSSSGNSSDSRKRVKRSLKQDIEPIYFPLCSCDNTREVKF